MVPFKECITEMLSAHAIQKHDAVLEQVLVSPNCYHERQTVKANSLSSLVAEKCVLRDVICILDDYL